MVRPDYDAREMAYVVMLAVAAAMTAGCSQAVSSTALQDAQTAVRVKTALVNDPVLGVRPIEVSVSGGVARLSGSVASAEERTRAGEVARKVEGVSDVRLELTISAQPDPPPSDEAPDSAGTRLPARARAPVDPRVDEELREGEPRLLAVGMSMRLTTPRDSSLDNSIGIGPLIRVGSGTGLGVSIGLGWYGADVSAGRDVVGHVRVRPVMAGLGYTVAGDRTSASLSLTAGRAFNALADQGRSPGPTYVLEVSDSFAWRPGLSLWFEASRRIAVNVSAGYLVTRPTLTWLEDGQVTTRTLRADTTMISTGVVYKLF